MGRLVRKPTLPTAEVAQATTGDFGGIFQAPARARPAAEAFPATIICCAPSNMFRPKCSAFRWW